MDFIVRQMTSRADTALVRYDCECGCKPNAKYVQGSSEAGHEHCCCGNVHFVGPQARQRMETYLAGRRASGEDTGLVYALHDQQVGAPWGESLAVAYALPDKPKQH